VGRASEKQQVLLPHRPVEAEQVADGRDVVRSRVLGQEQDHRIAGDPHEEEDDGQRQENRPKRLPARPRRYSNIRGPAGYPTGPFPN